MTPDQRWALDLRDQIELLTRDIRDLEGSVRWIREEVHHLWSEDDAAVGDLTDQFNDLLARVKKLEKK